MKAEHKITCKFFGSGSDNDQQMVDYQMNRIDIEPDNLELNERIELPQLMQNGRKNKHLFIYTLTNGFSKILVFADISREKQQKIKDQEKDQLMLMIDEIHTKTFKVEMINFSISLICTNFRKLRKEFAFIYLEDLKFIVLDAE